MLPIVLLLLIFYNISAQKTFRYDLYVKDTLVNFIEISKRAIAVDGLIPMPTLVFTEEFNGLHLGLTITLWENKNKVNTQHAELILNEANLQDRINERYYDITQKFERMTNLKITLDEYQTLFSSLKNLEFLDKSLSLGQISTIEYFKEMTYYYEALKNYLKTEME